MVRSVLCDLTRPLREPFFQVRDWQNLKTALLQRLVALSPEVRAVWIWMTFLAFSIADVERAVMVDEQQCRRIPTCRDKTDNRAMCAIFNMRHCYRVIVSVRD